MKNHDLRRFIQSYGTLMALAAITLVFCVIRPASFCTVKNFINITRQISLLVMISLGATAVMSVNEFDLSIGSMASLGGVMAALLAVRGLPMVVCFLLPIVVSVAIGLVNGWIVARFRVLSFITTLGMSTVLSGVIYRLSGGATIFENIPDSFSRLGTAKVGQLPLLSILMAAFTALFFFLLEQTTLGRKLYAIGGNEAAAEVAGVNVYATKIRIYILASCMFGLAGCLLAAKSGGASVNTAMGYELDAIAACTIGGVSTTGGVGTVPGVLVGVLVFELMKVALQFMNVNSSYTYIVQGLVIIVAVAIDIRKYLAKK